MGLTPLEMQTRALWSAVAQHSLFGDYDPAAMEDANTLLTDMLCGIDDHLVADLCGIKLETTIRCSICCGRIDSTAAMLSRLFRAHPVAAALNVTLWRAVATAAIGELQPRRDDPETILSLPINTVAPVTLAAEKMHPKQNIGDGASTPPGTVDTHRRYAAMTIGYEAGVSFAATVTVEDVRVLICHFCFTVLGLLAVIELPHIIRNAAVTATILSTGKN